MQFMMLVKSDERTEAGAMPDPAIIDAMTKYNEDLAKAGVLVSAEGLHPTSKGALLRLAGGKRATIDGPYAEAKEVIAGYWILRTKTREEAIAWAKRNPGAAGNIELRQLYETDDFPVDPAEQEDGWRAKEERMRKEQEAAPKAAVKPGTKRFIAMLTSDKVTESGVLPDEKMLSAMGKLMEDMGSAGVIAGGEGLQPSAKGVRIKANKLTDGPFAESKELIAGFMMLRCKSLAEAIEWSWRWLDVHCSGLQKDGEIQVRQVFEMDELPPSEAVERAKKLTEQLGR
ncbi:MAG TPA: YciI family protein [Polyangiaceae bacterium]|jgi:hypothetical protein|nr:YciI family protein [Polyangiaceae bacterium]